jgi:hypothetical protein
VFTDFENVSIFKPGPQQEASVNAMLDQLIAWGGALKMLRKPQYRLSNGYGHFESKKETKSNPQEGKIICVEIVRQKLQSFARGATLH